MTSAQVDKQLANDPLASSWAANLRSTLRGYARAHLPEAMIPAHFVVLTRLPKLPNGKVDRASLPPLVIDERIETLYVAPRTAVEVQLTAIWQDLLGLARVGVSSNFFDLGGNSLTLLQMAARAREIYNVRLDLGRLIEDPTVARLASMVSTQADPTLTGASNARGISTAEMLADAVLPDDVVVESTAIPASSGPYREILLTGATGYTGAFLLRELIDGSDATIHVLGRAASDAEAGERVRQTMTTYGLWRDGDTDRIVGVAGDTGRPYLGLSPRADADLAERIELIVHNAAESSWTIPYARIKPVNVLGSLEILRLSGRRRIKPVHYVCSIAVYPGRPGDLHWPEVEQPDPDQVVGGYRQTKWVADRMMTTARRRGLPTHIYRVGAITGASDTGACATDTFINDLIKGCIQLGSALEYDLTLEFVPVDYCARVVSHIALSGSATEGVFNVPGARPVSMNHIVDLLIGYGYPLRRLPYPLWYRELIAAIERGDDNELAAYLPLFGPDEPAEEIGYAGSRPTFGTEHLQAALDDSGITCPPVDQQLFNRYLDYFVSTGYLPPASGRVE